MAKAKTRAASAKAKRVPTRPRRSPRALALAGGASSAPAVVASAPGPEKRIASRAKRDTYLSLYRGRLPNTDRTLMKFGGADKIGLFSKILYQFPDVAGMCRAFVDNVLKTDLLITAAKGETPEEQALADEAAKRAIKAWFRVQNRVIGLQCALMFRFYGFARLEKVWRFDDVIGEWIQDLFNVDQEAWVFGPNDEDYLVTTMNSEGDRVDSSRFIHLQWGSAETKYGAGDLSFVYLLLWKIQKLEERMLKSIEKYSDPTTVIHVPRGLSKEERADFETDTAAEFESYITVPTDESHASYDQPAAAITSAGAQGRQELEVIRFYQSSVQTFLMGAPMTGNKSLGTGKLEDVRQTVWEDKTPLAGSAVAQFLTRGWLDSYFAANMPDLPPLLRAYFDFDSTDTTGSVATGIAAQNAMAIAVGLGQNQITDQVAIELWTSLGFSPTRARAMTDSTMAQRASLTAPAATQPPPFRPAPQDQNTNDPNAPQEAPTP